MSATVLQLSDTHLGAEPGPNDRGLDPDERLEAVLRAWSARDLTADLIVLTGDDADDGSPGALDRLAAAVARLGSPVMALPGNHDDPTRVRAVFGAEDTVEVGGWRIVGVDTSRPGEVHGTVEVDLLLARLDALDTRPTVLALHHPPRSRSTHPWFRLDGAAELLAGLAVRPQVRAVISGHLHDPFELQGPGDLVLLGGPSTLLPIAHAGDRYRSGAGGPTGARVLYLSDDGAVTTEIIEG